MFGVEFEVFELWEVFFFLLLLLLLVMTSLECVSEDGV